MADVKTYQERIPTFRDGVVTWAFGDEGYKGVDPKGLLHSYFPFTDWLTRYNKTWFIGDLIAGVTVAGVVVPQGMAYAKLANLPVQHGLYSSFVGCFFYWWFSTSKDITIGPVAVLSQIIGSVVLGVAQTHPEFQAYQVAGSTALVAGIVVFAMGILRLGFVVDFIPLPAILAFCTGGALSVGIGQIPTILGINRLFNTRAETYLVFINTFKYLPQTSRNDAAIGVTTLVILYIAKFGLAYLADRYPARQRTFFFLGTLRNVVMLFATTLTSYLINRGREKNPAFSLVGDVPTGFTVLEVPRLDGTMLSALAPHLPTVIIVTLIEHIAIAKSFGRINNYNIVPSQELIAMGFANIIAPFFGGYGETGSFSRTALKSKCGVRTPLAGVITSVLVILAIFVLPPLFYYISNAALAAVIVHAVFDLLASPQTVYKMFQVSPIECFIFLAGVIVTVFTNIEYGIYTSIGVSVGLLLYRIAKPHGHFVGRVKLANGKSLYIPIDHADGSNPEVPVESPLPGVFIYKLNEGFLFPNANVYLDHLTHYIKENSRPAVRELDPGLQTWNEKPITASEVERLSGLPPLRAVVLDFSGVPHVDVTASQNLLDVKGALERYSGTKVQWHFAGIQSQWVKRVLIAENFVTGLVPAPPAAEAIAVTNSEARLLYDPSITIFHPDVQSAVESIEATLSYEELVDGDAKTGLTVDALV